jgi:putative membrane-bound dehydrogenase-like protein
MPKRLQVAQAHDSHAGVMLQVCILRPRKRQSSAALVFAALSLTNGFAAPLSPEQELATFQLADPDLRVELVAAEPDVISPVAIAFDTAGRMFVAEMMDYPLGPEGGQIRCLEDRDGDGRFEAATVFAAKLPYPNGVLPWNGGVLVTAAPDILFLKDTDGDNHADERRVILTGFGKGNQQLRVNGLMWGLDNWVYGANGRSDGEVRGVSLRGHDFRFRPATGEFETLAGRSQFGLARDEWGNRFLSWNTTAVRHEVIPERYLLRNPNFSGTEGVFDITERGDSGEVFALTPVPLTFNKESTSHFNALAGLTIYRGDAHVGETLRNLVHRRRLVPDGPTFVAKRVERGKEFLASTDPWFHPVNFANGPDGALYIVDFYRQFVEHPHYVPEKLRDSQPWRTGAEHGRIWRIVNRKEEIQRRAPKLDQASPVELVAHLKDSNPWWRDTAQRLLVEERARETIPLLKTVLRETNPLPAVHALWILEELGALDDKLLAQATHTREHMVRIAERRGFVPKVGGDPRLDLQVILSLGEVEGEEALDRLAQLALKYSESRWHTLAVISSVARRTNAFLAKLPAERRNQFVLPATNALVRAQTNRTAVVADRRQVVQRFEPALKLKGDPSKGRVLFEARCVMCHPQDSAGTARQGRLALPTQTSVGPSLAGMSARPREALLVDILDPSAQVAPDFAAYTIVLQDADPVSGLILVEDDTRVTVRRPNEPDAVVPRSRIREIRAEGKSVMPDGLEEGLTLQDLADLLAFLIASQP